MQIGAAFPVRGQTAPLFRALLFVALFAAVNAGLWSAWLGDVIGGILSQSNDPAFANRDFANYWLAGRLSLSGEQGALFSQVSHQARLESAFGLPDMEIRAWSYPPHFLLVTLPLGLLPYPLAYPVFMAASLAFFLWAAGYAVRGFADAPQFEGLCPRLILRGAAMLLLPFMLAQVAAGQNGFFFSGLMLVALAARRDHALLTGLALAFLTMKPQLGILFPLLLLFERRYAAIAWTVVFTALLVAVSVAMFGPESWTRYAQETIPYQHFVATSWQGVFLAMMPTVFGSLRAAGVASDPALTAHLAIAAAAFLAALWGMATARDALGRSLILVSATFVIGPYAFSYDIGALLALFAAVFAACLLRAERGPAVMAAFALLAALPLWTPMPVAAGSAAAPVLILPALVILGSFAAALRLSRG